jgi:hypoxanthine phosphoribosyltransferase
MKKKYYTWDDVDRAANSIIFQMYRDNWRPDYIVGITRGGLPLAILLSHKLNCRMETLKVKLRDGVAGEECETNCWMADDAYGYGTPSLPATRKKILVVDDINDTGATFNWIKKDWQSSFRPEDPAWTDQIWGGNVRFAVMTQNWSSDFDQIDYYWDECNKAEENIWLVYPYESN